MDDNIEIITYSYRNKEIYTAPETDRSLFDEVIAYTLGEMLLRQGESVLYMGDELLNYISASLHTVDKPNLQLIYEEIIKRVEQISSDRIFQSLSSPGDFYLKYEYQFNNKFTRLQLFVDPTEKVLSI